MARSTKAEHPLRHQDEELKEGSKPHGGRHRPAAQVQRTGLSATVTEQVILRKPRKKTLWVQDHFWGRKIARNLHDLSRSRAENSRCTSSSLEPPERSLLHQLSFQFNERLSLSPSSSVLQRGRHQPGPGPLDARSRRGSAGGGQGLSGAKFWDLPQCCRHAVPTRHAIDRS